MSYGDCFHEETRVIDGVAYYITHSYDNHTDPPWDEGLSVHREGSVMVTDGYGVLFRSGYRAEDYDPEEYADTMGFDPAIDADATALMEQAARMQMAKLLYAKQGRHDKNLYLDVWETLKIARKDGWGGTDHTPEEAVERMYQWMRGWYNDDWHYIGIEVTNKSNGQRASLWGVESEDTNYHEEVIADLIAETSD